MLEMFSTTENNLNWMKREYNDIFIALGGEIPILKSKSIGQWDCLEILSSEMIDVHEGGWKISSQMLLKA